MVIVFEVLEIIEFLVLRPSDAATSAVGIAFACAGSILAALIWVSNIIYMHVKQDHSSKV